MNSKTNLSNSNLIKKLLIGLTICLMMFTGVLTSTPETVKADVIKNKTFYIYSDYEVEIAFRGNNDDTGITKYPYWPSHLGTITLSGYGTYNGKKGYKVEMKNVNVTDYTPYCEIRAFKGSGYYPASITIVGDDKQTGANKKANPVHKLDDISTKPDYRFFYIGYEYTATELQINYEYLNYTLSYNLNGGTSNSAFNSQTKKHDVNLTIHSAIPTKLGHKFICWKDSGGTTYGGTGGKNVYSKNQNDVLTAQWEASKYKIEYNPNKPATASHSVTGTMSAKTDCTFGLSVTLAKNTFELEGWEFTGWNTKADGTGTNYLDEAIVNNLTATNGGTATLYAQWKPNKYTVVFEEQAATTSGTPAMYEKYDVGWYDNVGCTNAVTYIKAPEKIGYQFNGYFTETNGQGKQLVGAADSSDRAKILVSNNSITEYTKAYAHWIPAEYTITLDKNGGSGGTNSVIEKYGVSWSTSSISVPTKANHTFVGYYTEKATDDMIKNGIIPTGWTINKSGNILVGNTQFHANTTLYAYWIPNEYLITLDSQGASTQGTPSLKEQYGVRYFTGKNRKTSGTQSNSYSFTGEWQYFVAPYEGSYTFSGAGATKTLEEGQVVKIYVR